jgi:hypothetical protein
MKPAGEACLQITVPRIAPIAAVAAIARAPQNVTRIVGLRTSAPPVRAPTMPSKARKASDPTDTTGISQFDGETSTRASGAAAPTENVAADGKLCDKLIRAALPCRNKPAWICHN